MSKEISINIILNKKIKRENNLISNSQLNESTPIKRIQSINIRNSIFNFDDLKGNEKNNILKIKQPEKSKTIKSIENNIKYVKCNYNSINVLSYECKKILNIPKEIIKNNNKHKLLLRLIYYNKKSIFIIGYWNNILIYEIVNNDIFFVCSFFEKKLNEHIENIFILKENNLSNKLQFFIIVKNLGLIYELDLKDYKLNVVKDNIILYQLEEYIKNYKFKLINNKLIIYNDNYISIYNIADNQFKELNIINMEAYENIYFTKKLTEDLLIINTDQKLYLFDSIKDKLLFVIETELRLYWTKILILKNNQFLLYSGLDIYVYDFDFKTKKENGKLNRKLKIKNIKFIHKIKQLSNEDLIINYNFHNILVYDIKKNIEKYRINEKLEIYSLINNYIIFDEIEPNIIAYKNNLYQINFLNAIKGEILGYFNEGNDISIKIMKKIKLDFVDSNSNKNILKNLYFIITNKTAFILYK